MDAPQTWRRATALLTDVLDRSGLPYERAEDEAAFYGPKIDVQFTDAAGREFTLSTVQVDFHQPERFDLTYVGADGAKHRPVMVHRSVIGSVERAMAHLIEVHGGAFPAWLAPVQVAVLPVSADQFTDAVELVERCEELGVRAELSDPGRGSLGARIRSVRLAPYQAVIGAKEAVEEAVAVRLRDGRRLDPMPVRAFAGRVRQVVRAHSAELWS